MALSQDIPIPVAVDIGAIQSGASWPETDLTFGFDNIPANIQGWITDAFGLIESYIGLTFTLLPPAGGVPDIEIIRSSETQIAAAYTPNIFSAAGGDILLNLSSRYFDPLSGGDGAIGGNYIWSVFLHEIGHSLGLKHGHEGHGSDVLREELDTLEHTVMSYRSTVGADVTTGYTNPIWDYPQTLMPLDIAALQQLYGARFTTGAGDSTYRVDPETGAIFRDAGRLDNSGTETVFFTIWDGGGRDRLDLSDHTRKLVIDLRGGGGVDFDRDGDALRPDLSRKVSVTAPLRFALAVDGVPSALIEEAIGGAGDDVMSGNAGANFLAGGNGDDQLFGADGNDHLSGGSGADRMDGGNGSDLFIVDAQDIVQDSGDTGYDKAQITSTEGLDLSVGEWQGVERINGFTGNDRIDASALSADLLIFGDAGADELIGGSGDDVLIGGDGSDILSGQDGDDVLLGSSGANLFDGGDGNDVFFIGDPGDRVRDGGAGFDKAVVTSADGIALLVGSWVGVERVNGLGGADRIDATGLASDIILAGAAGDDVLIGGSGDDTLYAGGDDDRLQGNAGHDALIGGAGDDQLDGGAGDDFYLGGTGQDIFIWAPGFGRDVVGDFTTGTDRLRFAAHDAISELSDLSLVQSGAHTVITIASGGTDEITLAHVTPDTLSASDFEFT